MEQVDIKAWEQKFLALGTTTEGQPKTRVILPQDCESNDMMQRVLRVDTLSIVVVYAVKPEGVDFLWNNEYWWQQTNADKGIAKFVVDIYDLSEKRLETIYNKIQERIKKKNINA